MRDMQVGDFVCNKPHNRSGVIIEHLETILAGDGRVAEQVFLVLYNNPTELLKTGDSFLDVVEVAA